MAAEPLDAAMDYYFSISDRRRTSIPPGSPRGPVPTWHGREVVLYSLERNRFSPSRKPSGIAVLTRQPGTNRVGWAVELCVAGGCVLLPLGVYLAGALAAAGGDGSSLAAVRAFDPDSFQQASALRLAASAAMAVGAVGFLFVVPGLLGTLALMRLHRTRSTAHAWSLAANSAALVLVFLLLRHTWGVGRVSLMIAWTAWTGLLLAVAWRPGESRAVVARLAARYGGALLIGLAMVLAAMGVFFPEQFRQCFSEDGTETYELARSLRDHFLPYWELETWESLRAEPDDPLPEARLGTVVVNPSLVNSYWTCGLQCLLGDGEPSTRLSYWVWWMAIFAVCCRLVGPPRAAGASLAAVPLGLTMLLVCLLFTFYVGYNPYMADLANPGVPDALFTLLVLLSLDCLRRKDRAGWVISVTLASLVLYAGAVLLASTLAAAWLCRPMERKEIVRWGSWGAGALLAVVLFYVCYGWLDGSLPCWVDTIDIEYVNDYLSDVPLWQSGPLFLGYFLLGCGGAAAWGLVRAFRCGAWERTVAVVTLLYLLVALGSGFKNLHYFGPLLPIPIILLLRTPTDRQQGPVWRRSLAAVCSVLVCLAVCWPKARSTFTLNRTLGHSTTIAADSYPAAVRLARVRYELRRQGLMSWDCDQHTWVVYAELDAEPARPRPLLISSGRPPGPPYRAIARWPGGGRPVLYAAEAAWIRRLSAGEPLRPLHRYPAVFRPLADGLFSPHNNPLEDVRRLHWPW